MKIETARDRELSEGYAAFELEYAQHPERFLGLAVGGEGLEPSNGSEWLTGVSREV